MTNENTTAGVPAAMLNENELFENFMRSTVDIYVGRRKRPQFVAIANMLGGYENHELEEFCERLVTECSDLSHINHVADNLFDALNEARQLVKQLEFFHEAFESFKDDHLVDEYEGLENCYRVPSFPADKEAA